MNKDIIKKSIAKIVKNNLNSVGSYQLFLFGPYLSRCEADSLNFDIGIDTAELLHPQIKLKINREIENLLNSQRVCFIDFSRVDRKIKDKIIQKCEFIIN